MKRVEWTDSAIEDLNGIKAYLSEYSPEYADSTIRKLIRSARWLCDTPFAGPPAGFARWRKWKPKGQRYVLIYQPVERGISVVRVRHERADWQPVPV